MNCKVPIRCPSRSKNQEDLGEFLHSFDFTKGLFIWYICFSTIYITIYIFFIIKVIYFLPNIFLISTLGRGKRLKTNDFYSWNRALYVDNARCYYGGYNVAREHRKKVWNFIRLLFLLIGVPDVIHSLVANAIMRYHRRDHSIFCSTLFRRFTHKTRWDLASYINGP